MKKSDLNRFADKMRAENLPAIAIESFLQDLEFVASGGATTVGEDEIEGVESLPDLAGLDSFDAAGRRAAEKAVVLKLNGGLGTGMGLSKAKSLLPVRPGVSFLDLIARQVMSQRSEWKADLPLVLMNSFRTRDDSLAALRSHDVETPGLPLDFLQHKVPRIDAESWSPIEWSADRALEWCPPGHGDLYIAMKSSGMLDSLLSRGLRYAFVSNSDNLGGTFEPRILGWMVDNEIPFAMEVAERTLADRKGGHLARRNGNLMLREVAQCRAEDEASFQDVARHRFFNTNNLWVDLQAIAQALDERPGGLGLPVMSNQKHVVSTDSSSPRCLQLETAMGAAIECFNGAQALVVGRERFAPVKTTNDLLLLWSDAYRISDDARMIPSDSARPRKRVIDLDKNYYGHVNALESRFPHGAPSLVDCDRLSIVGDHVFGENVVVRGNVALRNESATPVRIESGTRFES